MPLTRAGNGTLVETPIQDKDQFDRTGAIRDDQFAVVDQVDKLKQLQFEVSGQTHNTVVTLSTGAGGARTVTLPAATGTLVTSTGLTGGTTGQVLRKASGTDLDYEWKSPPVVVSATSVISALDIDWSLSNSFSKTLGVSSTFTFSNTLDGECITVALTNTASNFTVTWPVGVLWSGGSAPVQTVGAKTDIYTFLKIGSVLYGSVIQNF